MKTKYSHGQPSLANQGKVLQVHIHSKQLHMFQMVYEVQYFRKCKIQGHFPRSELMSRFREQTGTLHWKYACSDHLVLAATVSNFK